MSDKYSKLAKNTVVFAIGSLGSKIISFFIVPLYTFVLTPAEYGTIDIITTTISFIIPFATLMIQEALLRFLLGREIETKIVLSNCWLVFTVGSFLSIGAYFIYVAATKNTSYAIFIILLIIVYNFNAIFTHYLRAEGKNVEYTIQGLLLTFFIVSFNFTFLVIFKLRIVGYLSAVLLANFFVSVYIIIVGKVFRQISFKYIDFDKLNIMLKYSVPLIPNSLMWWIMSGGDKYIINYNLGSSANGIYSIAMKIPTIISMFFSMFFQAWQLSAIEENGKEDEREFYENLFVMITALLVFLTCGITLCTKLFFKIAISEEFFQAWKIVPTLCIATIFSCYASFFSVAYTTSKKTTKVFYTTAIGTAVNIVFNFLLINRLGLQGVAIATALGYAAMTLIRAKDTYALNQMGFDAGRTVAAAIVVILQTVVTINGSDISIILSGLVSILFIAVLYKNQIKIIAEKFLKKFKAKGR